MKASNEEVTSINEELQSTNEELETSKEELQSLNEELTTVNAQLQAKMDELQATTNDLASLLSSTDLAVVFLDPQFRIRRFTPAVRDADRPDRVGRRPAAARTWPASSTRPGPAGRRGGGPGQGPGPDRAGGASTTPAGHWYVRRITRTGRSDDRINGVVLSRSST